MPFWGQKGELNQGQTSLRSMGYVLQYQYLARYHYSCKSCRIWSRNNMTCEQRFGSRRQYPARLNRDRDENDRPPCSNRCYSRLIRLLKRLHIWASRRIFIVAWRCSSHAENERSHLLTAPCINWVARLA